MRVLGVVPLAILPALGDVSDVAVLLEVDEARRPDPLLLLAVELAVPEDELEASRESTPSPSDSASETLADEVAPPYSFSECDSFFECLFHGLL